MEIVSEEERTHVLDLDAANGVNKRDGEPVAGDGAEARGDGVPCCGLEHLIVHLLRALAVARVVATEGRNLRTPTNVLSTLLHPINFVGAMHTEPFLYPLKSLGLYMSVDSTPAFVERHSLAAQLNESARAALPARPFVRYSSAQAARVGGHNEICLYLSLPLSLSLCVCLSLFVFVYFG